MSCRSLFYIFILLLVWTQGKAEKSEILFRKISPDGGFSYGFVNAIAEDSSGFIWVGTDHGLFRYDTREIIHFCDDEKQGSLPSNNILSLYASHDKTLWIVTDRGLYYYDQNTDRFVPQRFHEPDSVALNATIREIRQNRKNEFFTLHTRYVCQIDTLHSSYKICPVPFEKGDSPSSIYLDRSDVLWIGTEHGSVFRSSSPYKEFNLLCRQHDASVRTMCEDNNSMWIGYEWGGADHITAQGSLIDHYDQENSGETELPHNRVRKIIKDQFNNIWIATYKGICIVSREGNRHIRADNYNELPHSSIKELFMDSGQGIWVGTWSGGLAYYHYRDNRFLHFKKNPDRNSIGSNIISSFSEDEDNNIWVGTEDDGLQVFDRDHKKFSKFELRKRQRLISNVKCLAADKNSGLWVGTLFDGLWRIDLLLKTYQKYNLFDNDKPRIYSLLAVDHGLWIGTFGDGLLYYDTATRKLTKYLADAHDSTTISSNFIRTIFRDSYGGLWIGTQNGLNYRSKGSIFFQRVSATSKNKSSSISNNEIYSVIEDSDGQIWIGTEKGLNCFKPTLNEFIIYSKDDGLSGTNIYSILEDNSKRLWISTENGLSSFDLKDKSIRIFGIEDGLQGNQFNPGASFECQNGELLFGGPNGFNLITPSIVKRNPNIPHVIITRLFINNKPAGVNEPANKISKTISSSGQLRLNHLQNTLTFEFISTNFIQPGKNEFKYRLVNYNDDWVYAGTENKASFTKIPPGKYVFEVMGSNNNGIWSPEPQKLELEIIPPLWATWYSYLFYALSFISIVWYVRKEILLRQNLKKELLVERVKNENEEKLYELKMKFFTNVTHEFRTPLTLILSPVEYLLRKKNYEQDTQEHLDMIRRNAMRLKILINQILDFRKLELGKSTLSVSGFDLVKICTDIYSSFEIYAKDRSMNYHFGAEKQSIPVTADLDKIEKILFNLISNAFRHTPDNGQIDLIIQLSTAIESNKLLGYSTNEDIKGPGVEITVRNTGKKIPEEEIPLLFTRFYQSRNSDGQGAGIGLHLCSEYAQLHHGSLVTWSNEKGTTFRLILPVSNGFPEINNETGITRMLQHRNVETPENNRGKDLKTTLIVEDNAEMLRYLKSILIREYHVITADNGEKGIALAREINPHLIISDILMPGTDGLELCRIIKQDIRTSHIPVILLTALSEKEKKIDGFNFGADAYIEKPFDDQLLMAQIKSLLAMREKLQQSFIRSIDQWKIYSDSLPFDKQLIEKAIKITENHLLDTNFSVEQLASGLNFSRSSLHRKLRDLTDQSATEFIRSVRLNKAICLMKQGNYNMEEIAYAVGFSSPSYFSQSFKKQYGKSPKAYLEEFSMEHSLTPIDRELNG